MNNEKQVSPTEAAKNEEKGKEIRRAYAQFIYIVTTECSYHSFNEFEAVVIY